MVTIAYASDLLPRAMELFLPNRIRLPSADQRCWFTEILNLNFCKERLR
jgi:hypothetical protein